MINYNNYENHLDLEHFKKWYMKHISNGDEPDWEVLKNSINWDDILEANSV